jgi:hypothetical protein
MYRFKLRVILSLLAATASVGFSNGSRGDAALSIAKSFQVFWSAAQGKPFADQEALWDKYIESPRQDIYDSIVWEKRDYPDWRKLKDATLALRFASYPAIGSQIPGAIISLEAAIPRQAAKFHELFPDASAQPPVVIVLAPDFDSKSGVQGDGKPVLALSVDTLMLEKKVDLNILFPHELFHIYDATHAGVTNDGVMSGADITLPLFAEGLATYVSTLITPGHTDGQYLMQDSLGTLPAARMQEIAKRFLADAHQPAIETADAKAYGRWFESSKIPFQADLPNRSGYWLGLNLIREMVKTHTLQEMAAWSPAKAQNETRAALTLMAGAAIP